MVILLPFLAPFKVRIHYYIIHCICYYIQEECPMKMISKELTFVCIAKATFGEFQVHLEETYVLYIYYREKSLTKHRQINSSYMYYIF